MHSRGEEKVENFILSSERFLLRIQHLRTFLLIFTTVGSLGGILLTSKTSRATSAERAGKGIIYVLLGVDTNQEGRDVYKLVAHSKESD